MRSAKGCPAQTNPAVPSLRTERHCESSTRQRAERREACSACQRAMSMECLRVVRVDRTLPECPKASLHRCQPCLFHCDITCVGNADYEPGISASSYVMPSD